MNILYGRSKVSSEKTAYMDYIRFLEERQSFEVWCQLYKLCTREDQEGFQQISLLLSFPSQQEICLQADS